ncbi:FIG074102: hypothetical protein [hydrothermal vent metagenome]|uniref:Cytoplasmic protein n=1 Tax=hydrothermal vent metagenome TaxID=652676 RepID=A0A3B0YXD3_9ZZZZ
MSYKNSEITKKANIYDGGRVTSRRVVTSDGDVVTLGIMQLGSYHFATQKAEVMELLQGACRVKLAGSDGWVTYAASQSFDVPANSSFDIEVTELLDYICHYV